MAISYPDKRVIRTKSNLHNALLTLMKDKAFKEITITEIVQTAGYNRGTFYTHYDKKEDLLDEIIEEKFEEMVIASRKQYKDLIVVRMDDFNPHSLHWFDYFLENRDFYQIMLDPKTNYNFYQKLSEHIEYIIRNDFAIVIDPQLDIDIDLLNPFRINGFNGLILNWIKSNFNHPIEYMNEQLIKILKFKVSELTVIKEHP